MSTRDSDPSRSSYYIDDDFDRDLVERFSGFARDGREEHSPAARERCRALLEREARLLDERRFEDWLAMFVPECLYWVPGAPGGDPRREIAVAFDDRRQLEGRIYRLRTGYAWSQVPPSRTVRLVSNVEVFTGGPAGEIMARSNFLIAELRGGEQRTLAGSCAHLLVQYEGGLRIAVKQVNLIDCDRCLHNPSIIF